MNYWHIQLNQGRNNRLNLAQLQEILDDKKVIGLGDYWEDKHGKPVVDPKQFSEEMQQGDIVMVRDGKIPIALVKIVGDARKVKPSSGSVDWFPIRRDIEVLGYYKDRPELKQLLDNILKEGKRKHIQATGTLTKCGDLNRVTNRFVKEWWEMVKAGKMDEKEKSISVKIKTLDEIVSRKLFIPDYQRPYVWDEENIKELFKDWGDHFFKNERYDPNSIQYYMGSVMLMKKADDKIEIIDGQQRVTTMLIIDFLCNESGNQYEQSLSYASNHSTEQISKNKEFIKSYFDNNPKIRDAFEEIRKKLVFNQIITYSEDEAFIFFDSQNNRGIPLDEVDYFKSFHLRELKNEKELIRHFAKRYDKINSLSRGNSENDPKHLKTLNDLFRKHLWTAREWAKTNYIFPNKRRMLKIFQKDSIARQNKTSVKLYPSIKNQLGNELSYDQKAKPTYSSKISLSGVTGIGIPMIINQPIQRGIGFFLYSEKYFSIFQYIFKERKLQEEFNKLIDLVYEVYNTYFIDYFQTVLIAFYDKFGSEEIFEFALWFEHLLGSYRIEKHSIYKETVRVLSKGTHNVLFSILVSYDAEEVISELREKINQQFYQDKTKYDKGVRERYAIAIKNYYNISENSANLSEKKNWVINKIKNLQ